MTMTDVRRNGPAPLPPERAKIVEAGLETLQRLAVHNEDLSNENAKLKEQIAIQKVELDAFHQLHTTIEGRIEAAIHQRDEAIAHIAKWEALFVSINAQLRAFAVPATPMIVDSSEGPAALSALTG